MIWDGAFAPRLNKHRDFDHNSFFEHLMDNGGDYEVNSDPVSVKWNPIDASSFSPSRTYYFVDVDLGGHDGESRIYEFLISAEPDNTQPNQKRIRDEVDKIASDPIRGGRDWFDYLDFDNENTKNHPRVAARIEAGDRPRSGKPWHFDPREDEPLMSLRNL